MSQSPGPRAELLVHVAAHGQVVWDGMATSVAAPTAHGRVTVLPRHSGLRTALTWGSVTVRPLDASELSFLISGGVLVTDGMRVTIDVDGWPTTPARQRPWRVRVPTARRAAQGG